MRYSYACSKITELLLIESWGDSTSGVAPIFSLKPHISFVLSQLWRLNAHTDMKNTIALFIYTSGYRREDIGTDAGICAINGPA